MLAYGFEILAVLLLLYLVVLPFYPKFAYKYQVSPEAIEKSADIQYVKEASAAANLSSSFPDADYTVSSNRVIIPKIGVNAPIVESADPEYGLSLGAWRVPESSTPDKGGNTVITGHRFKYLPPNNLTFYMFHELEVNDIFTVIWEGDYYYYKIKEKKIVEETEVSILNNTKEPVVTLFTCHPIYSTDKRLVVVADFMEKQENSEL